jgi:folate-dependent tRNA-U54 methylase TrmFO/GidA
MNSSKLVFMNIKQLEEKYNLEFDAIASILKKENINTQLFFKLSIWKKKIKLKKITAGINPLNGF